MGGGGKGKSPTQKPDNLFSQDTVEMVLGIGEGTIRGLTKGLQSFYVDSTPLQSETGELNFQDIGVSFRQGYMDDQPVRYFMGGEASILNTATNVSLPAFVTRSFVTPTTLRGKISLIDLRILVQSLYSGDSGGNIYQTSVLLEIKYRKVGTEDWRYVLKGNQDLAKQRDLIKTARLLYAAQGIDFDSLPEEERRLYILNSQTVVKPLTQADLDEYNLAISEWRKRVSAGAISGSFQSGTLAGLGNVGLINTNKNITNATSISNQNPDLTLKELNEQIIMLEGKTTSGYVAEYCIPIFDDPDDTHDWEIQITRKSREYTSDEKKFSSKEIAIESIALVTNQERQYQKTAVCHVVAQHTDRFSQIPNFSGEFDGFMCEVPTNYNPDERTFSGIWDGTFKRAWTNNNALILREVIMNRDWGKRSVEPLITMDNTSLLEAIKWCDELLPDGSGGMKPRHTFNMVVQEKQNLDTFVELIAGSFHATVREYQGVVSLYIDRPRTPSFFVCPEVILQTGFQYSLTDLQTQYNQIHVTFLNADNNYSQDRRRIIDEASILKNGYIPYNFDAIGVTNLPEALRQAAYILYTNRDENVLVTFSQPRLGHVVQPYEWFYLADPTCGWGYSGRIEQFKKGTRTIYLRDPILPDANYKVTWHTHTGIVSATAKSTNGLDLVLTSPVSDNEYFLMEKTPILIEGGSYGNAKVFRIMSMKQSDSQDVAQGELFNFTGTIVSEDKYEKIEDLDNMEGLTLEKELVFYKRPTPPTPPELNYLVVRNKLNNLGNYTYIIDLSAEVQADSYEITWTNEYTNEKRQQRITTLNADLTPAFPQNIPLRLSITPIAADGTRFDSVVYTNYIPQTELLFRMPTVINSGYNTNYVFFEWSEDAADIFKYSDAYITYTTPSGLVTTQKILKGVKTLEIPRETAGVYSMTLTYVIDAKDGEGYAGEVTTQRWSVNLVETPNITPLNPPTNVTMQMLNRYIFSTGNGFLNATYIQPKAGHLIMNTLSMNIQDRVTYPNDVGNNPHPFEIQYTPDNNQNATNWVTLDYYSENKNLTTAVLSVNPKEAPVGLSKNLKTKEAFSFKKLGWLRVRSKLLAGGLNSARDSSWVYIQIPNTGGTIEGFDPLSIYNNASS